MKDSTVRARINSDLNGDVEDILASFGMRTSDAINALFHQIYLTRGLPFEIKVPNELTDKVLQGSPLGNKTKRFDSIDDLFKKLDV